MAARRSSAAGGGEHAPAASAEGYRIPEGRPERAHATGTAADFVPRRAGSLTSLARAAARCEGCHLHTLGTRTVFGEGPARARVMFVGEQPGDLEDREGRPFVGPAGRLLDEGLEQAGIPRDDVYVTNAVKHFKWERGEKSARRIHKKPNDREVRACRPWLEHEIALLHPEVIVCLGATAAQALLGKQFRVTQQRGRVVRSQWADAVIATVHPSAVLRAPSGQRARAQAEFFADLRAVARHLGHMAAAADREVPLAVARDLPTGSAPRRRATRRPPERSPTR